MGSKAWFDLIYRDDPKSKSKKKQESKGYVRAVEVVEEVHEVEVPVVEGPTVMEGVSAIQRVEGMQVEAVLGLEDQNFVLLDPNIDPLESVFIPMNS